MWTLKKTKPHPFHRLRLLIIFFEKKTATRLREKLTAGRAAWLKWTQTSETGRRQRDPMKLTCIEHQFRWRLRVEEDWVAARSSRRSMEITDHVLRLTKLSQVFFLLYHVIFSLLFFLCNSTFANVRCYFVVFSSFAAVALSLDLCDGGEIYV